MSCSCSTTAFKIGVAILTVSDRCYSGENQDTCGASLKKLIQSAELFSAEVVCEKICPDEKERISKTLLEWCEDASIHLIITAGGTGLAQRDVTPEAVKEVIEKEAPGMALQMISESLKVTPMAMLSRPVCGSRGSTLIITVPGSTKAALECLRFVSACIPHAIDLLRDRRPFIQKTHEVVSLAPSSNLTAAPKTEPKHKTVDSESFAKEDVSITSSAMLNIPTLPKRPRQSPFPLISVADAQAKVLCRAVILSPESRSTSDCLGFCLSEDIKANEPLPPFPASIKDGYAVVAGDLSTIRKVLGGSVAGTQSPGVLPRVQKGLCVRVNTGAPIPAGADAVIQVEETRVIAETADGEEEAEIGIDDVASIRLGQDIRAAGSDIMKGEIILPKGHLVSPADIGLMAASGVVEAKVYQKPIVSVLSTGNELQDISSSPLKEGRIYDSNKASLRSLLRQYDMPFYDAGIALDTPTHLLKALRAALRASDILVTTGGVSMGDRDILRPVLTTDLEAEIHFARVFMKPGKPTTFATCIFEGRPKLILGLPGNPVSCMVTAYLYLLPLCRKMSGNAEYYGTIINAKLGSTLQLDPRPEFHRARLFWSNDDDEHIPTARSTGNQISSRLLSMTSAQSLLMLPPASQDKKSLNAGTVVKALVMNL